jgi:hypothetical protein
VNAVDSTQKLTSAFASVEPPKYTLLQLAAIISWKEFAVIELVGVAV